MRSEIGSEFWDIPTAEKNTLFPEQTEWFISGRSALKAILRENRIASAALPVWCCDSMIQPFIDTGVSVLFYENDEELPRAEAALVMDYFGYSSGRDYSGYPGIVIRDVTHSLFSRQYADADYYFGSLRKWAGFLTGGYAWGFREHVCYEKDTSEYISLRRRAMAMKKQYIGGQSDSKEYLNLFACAEEELEKADILPADPADVHTAGILDVHFIREKRRQNAEMLLNAFRDMAVFREINESDCPMFVPIVTEKRNELHQYLIKNQIYCPVHWPMSDLHRLTPHTRRFFEYELSLVCDQRYGCQEMERMIELINFFLKNEG